jgi:hypothetical protein
MDCLRKDIYRLTLHRLMQSAQHLSVTAKLFCALYNESTVNRYTFGLTKISTRIYAIRSKECINYFQ